jgi:hypothetical protein
MEKIQYKRTEIQKERQKRKKERKEKIQYKSTEIQREINKGK